MLVFSKVFTKFLIGVSAFFLLVSYAKCGAKYSANFISCTFYAENMQKSSISEPSVYKIIIDE